MKRPAGTRRRSSQRQRKAPETPAESVPAPAPAPVRAVRHGLARVLSKRGLCSRTRAAQLIRERRVRLNGRIVDDPEHPADALRDLIEIDGARALAVAPVHVALNKPRGLITTSADERGRGTVYDCLADAGLPWMAPVGRLDKASEGLLLFTNDPAWADAVAASGQVTKTYHVQVEGTPDAEVLRALHAGMEHQGEWLRAERVALVRSGERTAWLEFVLRGGRNRQIRRMLSVVGLEVKRLIRIDIGGVALGNLAKGAWRHLSAAEAAALGPVSGAVDQP